MYYIERINRGAREILIFDPYLGYEWIWYQRGMRHVFDYGLAKELVSQFGGWIKVIR